MAWPYSQKIGFVGSCHGMTTKKADQYFELIFLYTINRAMRSNLDPLYAGLELFLFCQPFTVISFYKFV